MHCRSPARQGLKVTQKVARLFMSKKTKLPDLRAPRGPAMRGAATPAWRNGGAQPLDPLEIWFGAM